MKDEGDASGENNDASSTDACERDSTRVCEFPLDSLSADIHVTSRFVIPLVYSIEMYLVVRFR